MKSTSKIFIVIGTPGSGKDLLIQAVNDLGSLHATIVPKHTTRKRQADDGGEMICSDDLNYGLDSCDIIYENYNDKYGLKTVDIWEGIKNEIIQVIVISNIEAINTIKKIFGTNVKILFVHSEMNEQEYFKQQSELGNSDKYVKERMLNYKNAFNIFLKNYSLFDHVLIYSDSPEDLFDQLFRIFKFYEK